MPASRWIGLQTALISGTRYGHISSVKAAGRASGQNPHRPMLTHRHHRHIPVIETERILPMIPQGCSAVSIGRCEAAIPLMEFTHPERACYLFGPENSSVSQRLLARINHKAVIPASASLNLGITVNIVFYDRLSKCWNKIRSRRHRLEKLNDAD